MSGRPRLERRLPAALVLVPVELASLAGGFTPDRSEFFSPQFDGQQSDSFGHFFFELAGRADSGGGSGPGFYRGSAFEQSGDSHR